MYTSLFVITWPDSKTNHTCFDELPPEDAFWHDKNVAVSKVEEETYSNATSKESQTCNGDLKERLSAAIPLDGI
jgi:hypothetical protein